MEDRSWALELDQEQFEKEWIKRNPFSDVIPDVVNWANTKERSSTYIEPFNAEMISNDDNNKKIEETNGLFTATCKGCGRSFTNNVEKFAKQALRMHHKKCKAIRIKNV